ncbi:glycoside hydrolase family 15 protein [Aneurinibacillus sp. Ricciae_BoGa-3]|uniref:glycoside hydrolase family 15 protein n=1 Tax=Aneurinibacillus sp. Ricciae_BoGa-3 TaxID=3022697 RepID=UPI00233FD9C9|nr:glycoside hydrolase family 15 protein [Aneurinibacillus sp. Ricciae_BoGa-3]WCK56558.1 glycoside hydrolase family 15 protein [Aneurinibacillus sp. Ricciae_BoGa-3]
MEKKPYLANAVVGNSSFLGTLGQNGRLYRLWWPHIDFPQHVDVTRAAIIPAALKEISWIDEPQMGWEHKQSYHADTNIVESIAAHPGLKLQVKTLDYAVPDSAHYIRHFHITNSGRAPFTGHFFYYSSMEIMEHPLYNTTLFDEKEDALIHFRRDYAFAVGSSRICDGFGCGDVLANINGGRLNGSSIAMAPSGALSWKLHMQPGETVSIPLLLAAGRSIQEAAAQLEEAKLAGAEQAYAKTASYWRHYLAPLPKPKIADKKAAAIYNRSLLLFKLMADDKTGAVIAAPEFDETFSQCGGYAYCWGRDAAYITTAFDKAGLTALSRSFYLWALAAQSEDGSWQQRHYHDGQLAPSWGLQIDEGGSIIWGMWQHYLAAPDRAFLERIWTAAAKGGEFLLSYVDSHTGLPKPSRDLWEERNGEHTYSAAAVYGGFIGISAIARELGHLDEAAKWQTAAEQMKQAVLSTLWNPDRKAFYRGAKVAVDKKTKPFWEEQGIAVQIKKGLKGYTYLEIERDPVLDISLLGLAVPFSMVAPDSEFMKRTADAIKHHLTVPDVGGILRYEHDQYIGGNPWILTTLWLAQFLLKQGNRGEAVKLIQWCVEHATEMQLLPEQIDRKTGEPAWVVPLTWSHAMFVLTVWMMQE